MHPSIPISLIVAISGIYSEPATAKLGQAFAFVGAKGGVGSSTIAHNVGWTIARQVASDVVLADMDLAFGTASLDFKLDAGQGVAEAIEDAGRLDEVLLDRLLAKCGDHFSLLRAPGTLDRCYDLEENAIDPLIEIAQSSVPYLILDMPHVWNAWARNVLVGADEIIITAIPDLPNLRNAKSLITFLRQARPHDPPPKLILNQVGMPKRPEIKAAEFAKAVQLELLACIPFDPQLFGKASNAGQMVAEVSAKAPASKIFTRTGRRPRSPEAAPSERPVQFDDEADEVWLENRLRSGHRTTEQDCSNAQDDKGLPPCSANEASRVKRQARSRCSSGQQASMRWREPRLQAGKASPPKEPNARTRAVVPTAPRTPDTPAVMRPQAPKSDEYYLLKTQVFAALIEAIDVSQLAKMDVIQARDAIGEIVDRYCDGEEDRHVDFGAG